MHVQYSKESLKTLRSVDTKTAKLIRDKILQLASEPRSLKNNIKKLKGAKDIYWLRVGDWRVLYREDGTILSILKIGARSGVYR